MSGASPCLEHLQQEHHRLNSELLAIRHALSSLPASSRGPLPEEVRERLGRLRGDLAAHFLEQTHGGCVEEAMSRAPSACDQVHQVEAEHHELLTALDRLIQMAASTTASLATVAQFTDDFAARIHSHEVAETRLMEYALGGEASEYDVEGNE